MQDKNMIRIQGANIEVTELHRMFSQFGDMAMNVRKGVAYIIYNDPSKALQAKNYFHGRQFAGSTLKIDHYAWGGNYNDPQQGQMQIEQSQPLPASNIEQNIAYHPAIMDLRNDFKNVLDSMSIGLDKGYRLAEVKIRELQSSQDSRRTKLMGLNNKLKVETAKMKKYLSDFQPAVLKKFKALYQTPEIDMVSGVHNSLNRMPSGCQEVTKLQKTESFQIKNCVNRLVKVSSTQFMASFEISKTVGLFTVTDSKAKHVISCQHSPYAANNYVQGDNHWALFGCQQGSVLTSQLNPLETTCQSVFKPHNNNIIDIKPLITDAHDDVDTFLSNTKYTFKLWRVSMEEVIPDYYNLEFTLNSGFPQAGGQICSVDVLRKDSIVAGFEESRIRVFDLNTNKITQELVQDNRVTKVIKVDQNTFACTTNRVVKIFDCRTGLSTMSKNFNCELKTLALHNNRNLVFGGNGILGIIDIRKQNENIWVDNKVHQDSVVRDVLVVENMIVSADSSAKMHLWKI